MHKDFHLSETEKNLLKSLDFTELLEKDFDERLRIYKRILGSERGEWFCEYSDKKFFLIKQQESLTKWVNQSKAKNKWKMEAHIRISELERSLTSKELELFMEDIAELMLGIGVTHEEARTIMELSQRIEEAKGNLGNDRSNNKLEIAEESLREYIEHIKSE